MVRNKLKTRNCRRNAFAAVLIPGKFHAVNPEISGLELDRLGPALIAVLLDRGMRE